MSGVVIVGAGQAAASCAAKLRGLGYAGSVTVIGDELVAPYQRPPLSKAYLLGDMGVDRLTLRAEGFWAEQGIALETGVAVAGLDAGSKRVTLSDGRALGYEHLVFCTGAAPRRLPASIGGELAGVYTIRSLADVDQMRAEFRAGARLVVIGGGYIGLEAAAVARKLGLEVVLVEAAERILGRVACAETAAAVRALHRSHGVEIVEGIGVARISGTERASGVELSDGRSLPADFVIVGVGVAPNVALAQGLLIENGIAVDAQGRSSAPAIWAAGDCASILYQGARVRIESVGNAIDMGELVAANICGAAKDYAPKPWFWSDQFASKLQIAGWNAGYDLVVSRAGEGQSFWYFRAGALVAVDALDDARAYMVGKRLIEGGKAVTPEQVAEATDLKALM